jgi:hypothetical protein
MRLFMRKTALLLLLLAAGSSWPQSSQPSSQTARQALIEMFFGKTQGTFVKHLPQATREALERSGALATLRQYSTMTSQFQTQGQDIHTFETGPILLAGENRTTGQKFEIAVEKERESGSGEQDDIEVAFRTYKNDELQRTPFMPRVNFTMTREAQLWTLNEISVTLRLPLADPDLLKAITERMQPQMGPQVTAGQYSGLQRSGAASPTVGNEPNALAASDSVVIDAIRTILAAEAAYASRYPQTGYACTLSSLDGFGSGEPNEHQAMLIGSGLASGKKYGYVFTLSRCAGAPVTSYRLTAAPNSTVYGQKVFCADQSGLIRSSAEGNAVTCAAAGTPIP